MNPDLKERYALYKDWDLTVKGWLLSDNSQCKVVTFVPTFFECVEASMGIYRVRGCILTDYKDGESKDVESKDVELFLCQRQSQDWNNYLELIRNSKTKVKLTLLDSRSTQRRFILTVELEHA